jgi:hypothetical protein
MLETALGAGLPVIGIHTDDLVNIEAVIQEIAKAKPVKLPPNWKAASQVMNVNMLFWTDAETEVNTDLYRQFAKAGKQLIVVNPTKNPLIFDAGGLAVPDDMLHTVLAEQVQEKDIRPLMQVLRGLSLKSVTEILALTQSRVGNNKPAEVRLTRTMVMGTTQGLSQVDTGYEFYWWPPPLIKWVARNAPYFLAECHHSLIPRGVLLYGAPGVGKTMGAKAIARKLEVPLYRLDMATTLVKYMGDSEARFARALEIIEREAPCVVLIDEVEKLFGAKDDSGVIQRLLSQLLWWLAEHKSRVFTVMTSNNIDDIPPELYRPGRIDRKFLMSGLPLDRVFDFATEVYATVFGATPDKDRRQSLYARFDDASGAVPVPHALVAEMVYDHIKEQGWV